MIRILHSVSNMDRAGLETMLMNYYRHMDRSKIQFDFLCNKSKKGAYDEEIKALGGRIYKTPGLNPARYPQYLKYMTKLFRENNDYKIIEAHNGTLGVYALHAAKKNDIPVRICHSHNTIVEHDWKFPLKIFCKQLLPANTTHHFACGVEAARGYFGDETVNTGDYKLVYNAIEVERFIYNEEIRNRIKRENGLEGKKIIGHIGRFMTQKNHTFLLEIFAEICKKDEDAVLVLLGEGELQDKIKAKAQSLGISDKVKFMGSVSNTNEWYSTFDLFLLPSLHEGLPLVGVEAQANDLPCVFSDTISKEVALTDKAQFVSLDTPASEWADIVLNKIKGDIRRDNTQLMTEKHYNIATEAKKLQDYYLNLYSQSKQQTVKTYGGRDVGFN